MIDIYMQNSGNSDFAKELQKLHSRISLLATVLKKERIRKMFGSDAEILHRLFESIS